MKPKRDHVGLKFRWRLWRLGVETKPARTGFAGALVVAALLLMLSGAALAKDAGMNAGQWTFFNRNSAFAGYIIDKPAPGAVQFSLPSQANDIYTSLLMSHFSGEDIRGMTITAVIKVTTGQGTTFAFNAHDNTGPTPPTVRLVFWTTVGPGAASTDYWWSNFAGSSFALSDTSGMTGGTATLISKVGTAFSWSALSGETSAANPDAFEFAAAHVKQVGLSFGGGWFFLNGVAVSSGSATFEVVSYTIG